MFRDFFTQGRWWLKLWLVTLKNCKNFWNAISKKLFLWIFRWQGNHGLEKTSLYLFLIQINISEVVYFLVKCLCTIILFFLTFLKGQVFRLHVWTKESSFVSPLNTLFCSMEREYRVCSRMINQFMASWVKNDLWQSRVIFGRGFTWNIVEIWNPWGKIFYILHSKFGILTHFPKWLLC